MRSLDPIGYLLIKATEKRTVSKKQLLTSCVSFFLSLAILLTATFSWFTVHDKVWVDSDAVTVTHSSGLRVNHGEDISSNITLSETVKLAEASSVDGRNIFFPTTGTFFDDSVTAQNSHEKTSQMIFREGNVGDKNTKYYYSNFSLAVDSGKTDVYVKSYSVTVTTADDKKTQVFDGSVRMNNETKKEHEECPIRIAFIQDSRSTPVVIDPTALVTNYAHTYNAVSAINENGEPSIAESRAHSFSEYYFATDNPLFTVEAEQGKFDATMVVWLEGTGGNCDRYINGTVDIDIQLESNWDYMDMITFEDFTLGDDGSSNNRWIDDDGCIVIMSYDDTKTGKTKAVVMAGPKVNNDEHKNNIWKAALPDYIETNIKFIRYNPAEEEIWNVWYTEHGINNRTDLNGSGAVKFDEYKKQKLQEDRLVKNDDDITIRSTYYIAKRGNGYGDTKVQKERESPSIGYWQKTGVAVNGENTSGGESGGGESTDVPVSWYMVNSSSDWKLSSDYLFSKSSDDIYTLTLELASNTAYDFMLCGKNGNNVKHYANKGTTVTGDVSDLVVSELAQDNAENHMKLNLSAGKYTFVLNTKNSDNYKLYVSKVVENSSKRTVKEFIVRDFIHNQVEQEYILVLSNGNTISGPEISDSNKKYLFKNLVLDEGVTIASVKNNTSNTEYLIDSSKTFDDGDIYTLEFTSDGVKWT